MKNWFKRMKQRKAAKNKLMRLTEAEKHYLTTIRQTRDALLYLVRLIDVDSQNYVNGVIRPRLHLPPFDPTTPSDVIVDLAQGTVERVGAVGEHEHDFKNQQAHHQGGDNQGPKQS